MTKNAKPLTSRLLIKDLWYSQSLPLDETPYFSSVLAKQESLGCNNPNIWNSTTLNKGSNDFFLDKFLRSLIHGTFLKLGILTSDVRISKHCNLQQNFGGSNSGTNPIVLHFLYYPLEEANIRHLPNLIKLLKRLLKVRYPQHQFKFICIAAKHKFAEAKILNDFISLNGIANPNNLKFLLLKLIRQFKLLKIKKQVTKPTSSSPSSFPIIEGKEARGRSHYDWMLAGELRTDNKPENSKKFPKLTK